MLSLRCTPVRCTIAAWAEETACGLNARHDGEDARNDYNLSPSRYVATDDVEAPLSLEEALVLLAQADAALDEVMVLLGLGNRREACGS